MTKCIYCTKEKEEHEFSLEHIFPTALGGKALPDAVFKTRSVCRECNSRFGLYVDGAFLKSFFIKGWHSFHYLDYFDKDIKYVIPFTYLGTIKTNAISHPEYKYCDFMSWYGGSRVYHFHNNSDGFFKSYVSGHPIKFKSKKEAGITYLVGIKSEVMNNDLFTKLFHSYKDQFKYQKRISVNINLDDDKLQIFHDKDPVDENMVSQLLNYDDTHESRILLQGGSEWGILAKIGIGLGFNLFGEDYLMDNNCQTFKSILKMIEQSHARIPVEKIKETLKNNPVMGTSFTEATESLKDIGRFLAWDSGHTIIFMPMENRLIILIYLFNTSHPFFVEISGAYDCYQNDLISKFPNGWLYILNQAKKISVGGIGIPEYIAYVQGDKSFLDQNVVEQLDDFIEEKKRNRNIFSGSSTGN